MEAKATKEGVEGKLMWNINGLKDRARTATSSSVDSRQWRWVCPSPTAAQSPSSPHTHCIPHACASSFLISFVLHAASPPTQVNAFLHPPSAFMHCFHDLRLSFACFSVYHKRSPWRSLLPLIRGLVAVEKSAVFRQPVSLSPELTPCTLEYVHGVL